MAVLLQTVASQSANVFEAEDEYGVSYCTIATGRDSNTGSVTDILSIAHNASGTPTAGLGTGMVFKGKSSTTSNSDMAKLQALWDVATHASRSAALQILISGSGGDSTAAKFDDDGTAGNTRFLVYDVDNAQLERVSVGAADSGGAGFKVLRIAN